MDTLLIPAWFHTTFLRTFIQKLPVECNSECLAGNVRIGCPFDNRWNNSGHGLCGLT